VNEVYIRLFDGQRANWENREHFLSVAAKAMRRILVDYARGCLARRRGGGWQRLELEHCVLRTNEDLMRLVAIDAALTRLAERDERACKVVEMRFFGGYSEEEVAELLKVSTRTVNRDWRIARAWLEADLSGQ
jgi:RNA polymerase sigma factor (TIGR02999 family)